MRRFHAPGRVNLIGEHTDYSGGLVLPAAIDLGITFEGEAAARIRLRSGTAVDAAPDGSDLDAIDGWGRYVAAVAAELDALGRPPVGLAGELTATVPAGKGLSSSAALEVCVAIALCAVAGFELDRLELADACRRAELRAAGVPCGILDQASAVLGRAGHALLIDTATLEHRTVPLAGLELVVVDSGVERTLAGSGYAARRAELEEGLRALDGRSPRDVDPGELDGLGLPDVPLRRLRHVVTENRRVQETVAALAAGEPDRLGGLFRASHESLRHDFEVTVPELDDLVDRAYAAGALAARMTGGGFGGSVIALAAAGGGEALAASFPGARVCHAAEGAREL